MTDDVLDGEVVSEETTFTPDLSLLPATELLGWCQDAKQAAPDRAVALHDSCPAVLPSVRWRDPSHKGAHYQLPGRRCSCVCHTRPVL